MRTQKSRVPVPRPGSHCNKPGRHAFRMDAGADLLIDTQWSVGAFYHLEARENAASQSCNASVRYSF